MREDTGSDIDNMWELVWKAPVQKRVRVFLWLALHDRHLCNANRVRKQLTDDPRCTRCDGDKEETMLHLLRDCAAARSIWKGVGGAANYPSFFTGNLQQWIACKMRAEGLTHSEKWPIAFALTLWWNWRWRNCLSFGRGNDIPIDTGTFLRQQIDSAVRAWYNEEPAATTNHKREVFIKWETPPPGWVALNTDGASNGAPGLAGCGGIIRDDSGSFMRAFAANLGICSAYRAELATTEIGLTMAKNMGF